MRLTRMHPECFMVDTTHGTNNERKELFTVAGKDGNNFAFNACRCFIPNQQQWVFNLLFSQCLPIFFGKTITSRINLLVTDGATTEYIPILKIIGKNGPYPHCSHGLCYFHLVIQGWNKHVKPCVTQIVKEDLKKTSNCKPLDYG